MILPQTGIAFRCRYQVNRDARTVVIRTPERQAIAVTLIECYTAPENLEAGRAAKAFLESLLEENDDPLTCWLPGQRIRNGHGRLWIGTVEVAEVMRRHGHAFRTRAEMEAAIR